MRQCTARIGGRGSEEGMVGPDVDWMMQTKVHQDGAQVLDGILVRHREQGGAPFACTKDVARCLKALFGTRQRSIANERVRRLSVRLRSVLARLLRR